MTLRSLRAVQMADRVTKAAAEVGVKGEDVAYLLHAYEAAMGIRQDSGLTDDDPDFLRPGRTVLILAEDIREADSRVLALGAIAESRREELRMRPEAVDATAAYGGHGVEMAEWWRTLPLLAWGSVHDEGQPEERHTDQVAEERYDERVLEELVVAPLAVQRVALCEALDQIRHAHLWTSVTERLRAVAIARRVMQPLATRVDDVLARRYGWWLRRVAPALEAPAQTATDRAPSNG